MRVFGQFLVIGSVITAGFLITVALPNAYPSMNPGLIPIVSGRPPATDAATVLASAREALGGEKRLSAVKSFAATGRTRQVRGDNLVPIEFEIACELPDRYVRKDEIPAQESGPTATGFNGEELIQFPEPIMPTPPPGRAGGPATPPAAQMEAMRKSRVTAVKQDFVRLTLGMFAGSFSSYPLAFTYVGQAEAPQGKADVVDAKGAANFTVRLFVNSQTHLPIMVSWQAPVRGAPPARQGAPGGAPGPAPQGAPAAPAPQGAVPPAAAGPPARPAAPPAAIEYRIYYADYRDVDGLQWPFRLRRATGPDTTEETTFDRFRINAKIDPKKFEVRK